MAKSTTYHKYKAEGVCVLCGGERSGDTLMCEKHRQQRLNRQREWYRNNPNYGSYIARKRRYNLTTAEYNTLLEKQSGRCAICTQPLAEVHVDHDHETGGVRGLLCPMCNKGLGHFRDSPELLEAAASYLRDNPHKPSHSGFRCPQ